MILFDTFKKITKFSLPSSQNLTKNLRYYYSKMQIYEGEGGGAKRERERNRELLSVFFKPISR